MSKSQEKLMLSPLAQTTHDKDKDRFITVMMLPAALREDVFTLYALNFELAKTRDTVSEAMLGRIRLQWWREAIEECYHSEPRRHEITRPLAEIIQRTSPPKSLFDQLVDARDKDLEDDPLQTLSELMDYTNNTGGNSLKLAVWACGGHDDVSQEAAGLIGTAWALVGLMRALPFHLRAKKQWIPEELVKRHKIDGRRMRDLNPSDELNAAVAEVGAIIRSLISDARELNPSVNRSILPLLHLAGLTESYCKQLQKAGWNSYDPSMAQPSGMRMLGLIGRNFINRY